MNSSCFKYKIVFLIVIFVFLISISVVSASDNNQNQTDLNDNSLKSISLKASKLSTTYGSGKFFKVKAIDSKINKPVSKLNLILNVYTANKIKKISIATDVNGIAKYQVSKLDIGKHKIVVNVKDTKHYSSKAKTSTVKVSKAKLKISAPKINNMYRQNKKFQVTVKNKESDKVMGGIKVLIKVFTDNKYKLYSLKTDKNGVVSINTKSLKKGLHKVTVNVKATSEVKAASSKSTIKTIDGAKHIKLQVNGHTLDVKLENNKATKELLSKLKKGNIKIKAKEYGGFEKVGDLGFSIPTNDKYITTYSGDIVLYEGNQISLFYNSNSWEYTKIGKVQKVTSNDLKKILGSGDVTLILSN